jgi:hypothetical protein
MIILDEQSEDLSGQSTTNPQGSQAAGSSTKSVAGPSQPLIAERPLRPRSPSVFSNHTSPPAYPGYQTFPSQPTSSRLPPPGNSADELTEQKRSRRRPRLIVFVLVFGVVVLVLFGLGFRKHLIFSPSPVRL